MAKKYNTLVFVGRFQPLHLGHVHVIETAKKLAENVIVVIGSAFASRNIRNPFTFEERVQMVHGACGDEIIAVPARDYPYNDTKWIANVKERVAEAMVANDIDPNGNIGLIGYSKDETSYYLKLFPGWKSESVGSLKVDCVDVDATPIREKFLNALWIPYWYEKRLPASSMEFIRRIISCGKFDADHISGFDDLFEDFEMVKAYKRQWEAAPYPPTFVTVDSIVTVSGHILLVKRKASPGKGLTALPGGFLNPKETLLQGSVRELREETKLKVPEQVIFGSLKGQFTFDAPNRSSRGRTITTAFHFDLGNQEKLPKVRGADDAEKAFWKPLNELDSTEMFEDHLHIIEHFTGI